MQEEEAGYMVVSAQGNCRGLMSGYSFNSRTTIVLTKTRTTWSPKCATSLRPDRLIRRQALRSRNLFEPSHLHPGLGHISPPAHHPEAFRAGPTARAWWSAKRAKKSGSTNTAGSSCSFIGTGWDRKTKTVPAGFAPPSPGLGKLGRHVDSPHRPGSPRQFSGRRSRPSRDHWPRLQREQMPPYTLPDYQTRSTSYPAVQGRRNVELQRTSFRGQKGPSRFS